MMNSNPDERVDSHMSHITDNQGNKLLKSNFNPYTKEKIMTINRSIDLRDQSLFSPADLKSPPSNATFNNLHSEDTLLRSKKSLGYLSLPKILGIKTKKNIQ
jgi:hypothetical protein